MPSTTASVMTPLTRIVHQIALTFSIIGLPHSAANLAPRPEKQTGNPKTTSHTRNVTHAKSWARGYSDVEAEPWVKTFGSRIVVGENNRDILLRGVVFVSSGPTPPQEADYDAVASMHANTVRLALQYDFFYSPDAPEPYKDSAWKWLDAHVSLARKHHVYLILQMFEVEGAQFVPSKSRPFDYRIWEDAKLQDRFVRLWRAIAQRYSNEPQIIGYSLFCEPVVSGSRIQWSQLASRTVRAIREVDQQHVVFVEQIYGENRIRREVLGVDLAPEKSFFLVPDGNVIYEFYFFESDEYTHQFASWRADVQRSVRYPEAGMQIAYQEQVGGLRKAFRFDKGYLKFYLRRQLEFGRKHNVPMFVWGFGEMRNCFSDGRGGARWLEDVLDLFRGEHVHWTLLPYRDEEFAGPGDIPEVRRILASTLLRP